MGISEFIIQYSNTIIAIGGAGGVIVPLIIYLRKLFLRKIWIPYKSWLSKIDKACETLSPNGGKSIYDRISSVDKKLCISEVRSRTLVTNLEIGEWQSDINGQCTFVNSAACRMLNRTEADFIGRNWVNVIYPEDRERVIEEWDRAVQERRVFELQYRWLHFDGHPVEIGVTATPLIDSTSTVIGWLAVVRKK